MGERHAIGHLTSAYDVDLLTTGSRIVCRHCHRILGYNLERSTRASLTHGKDVSTHRVVLSFSCRDHRMHLHHIAAALSEMGVPDRAGRVSFERSIGRYSNFKQCPC